MSVIEVIRIDYPERTIRRKNGSKQVIPERYECKYQHNGETIAYYDSKYDVIFLNDDFINRGINRTDRKKWREWCFTPEYDRAMRCPNHEVYEYLFGMLGIDRDTKLSSYMNL